MLRNRQSVGKSTDTVESDSIDVNKLDFISFFAHVVGKLMVVDHMLKFPRSDADSWVAV